VSLKGIKARLRRWKLPKIARNVILVVFSLLIFDVLVVVLGASYLSENMGTFLGKSGTVILSDLLFLEGTVIFAIGTFIAVAKAAQKIKPFSEPPTEINVDVEKTPEKRINLATLLIIIGVILMGLSITVGTLLL